MTAIALRHIVNQETRSGSKKRAARITKPPKKIMKILKFGGSSLETPKQIQNIAGIIIETQKKEKQIAVVVSAFQGVTDQLIEMSNNAANGTEYYIGLFKDFEKRHINAIEKLISGKRQNSALANVKIAINELEDVLHGVFLVKECTPRTLDLIMSFGERLSTYILSEHLNTRKVEAEYVDTRELVKTDDNFGSARVNLKKTYNNIRNYFKSRNALQVITGFIGSTPNGVTTTLGRGGSDYTATLFGAALKASEIQLWTDVDGVMTADPKKVPKAFPIKHMTCKEALEMSHFGAEVVHPPSIRPALIQNIPIRIKNSFNPKFRGTLINPKPANNNFLVRGISSINNITLLQVQGGEIMDITGIAGRIFNTLAKARINVIFISQASSEHSICFAVTPENVLFAQKSIEKDLFHEINTQQIDKIVAERDLAIIAVVGENMRKRPGVAGKLFQTLGDNNINVVAIAQGSSELNISVVINKKDELKALNVIHHAFFTK